MRYLLLFSFFVIPLLHAADLPLAVAAEKAAKKLKAGGIVTGESVEGKVTFAGFASASAQKADYQERVLFEIGSLTKLFTGLLLAQAVVEEKVTLDTPISKLLDPNLAFADPRIADITLKQLSTHTSGLPRLPDNYLQGVKGNDPYAGYNEKLLLEYLTSAKLKKDGPYPCSYSNLGVGLLGHLLGKIYASTWEAAIVSKICQPLGLHNTRMTLSDLKLAQAPPFNGDKEASSWHFDALAGCGALHSTAEDLLIFGQAMAKPEATPLAKAFALALQPHADTTSGKIGLGPFISQRDGDTQYSHDGGTGGYRTGLQVIPAKNIVRVALINNTQMSGSSIIAGTRIEPPRILPKEVPLDLALLQQYPGVYALDQETRFTILLRDGKLWSRLTGQTFLPLFAKAKDQFFLKVVNAEIHFQREGGKITSLTLFQNGREMKAPLTDQAAPKIILHTAKELQSYSGNYALLGLQNITVSLRGNTLFAQLAKQPAHPVFDMGADRFEYEVVEAALIFNRNEKGEVIGLTLSQNGALLPAAKVKK